MRRVYIAVLIVVGVLVFVVVSAFLARVLSVDGAERGAITSLVQAEARGDQAYVLDHLRGCRQSPACRDRVAENIAALTHPGSVKIIQILPSAGFSLTSTLGTARVAWEVGSSLPIVQCLRIQRAGNALRGLSVELLAITPRIASDSDCPSSF
jgi:hypothetical protein